MTGDLYSRFKEQQEKEEQQAKRKVTNNKQEITMIDINLLDEFKNHIFSSISQNKFEELKESISRSGVLSPIIVRRKQDRYEIISGHNRTKSCKELGINEIPAIIKDYDDDMAELIMIETNLAQRENILPCEKGLAYKKRLELIKRISKEKETLYINITADVISGLLPIIDNFENAVKAECSDEKYKDGINLIYKSLMELLAKHNVEKIPDLGETFDATYHEAVMSVQDETRGEKEIVEVFRTGYRLKDKVVRHSLVKVAN